MNMNLTPIKYLLIVTLMTCCGSCKKLVETTPPATNLVSESVYASDATASAAVTGIYEQMMEGSKSIGGPQSMSSLLAVTADEFNVYPNSNQTLLDAYSNSVSSTSTSVLWNELYNYIYLSNAAIEGLSKHTGVTSSMRDQLLGESKFIRAFIHFYLVNIFGDVPLVLTSDYRVNESIARTPSSLIYQQIIADLKDAQLLLSDNYLTPNGSITSERVRPNKAAATALLARAYLYTQKWDSTAIQATAIINSVSEYNLTSLDSAFLKNSNEAIWQLQPVQPGYNTYDGYTYVLTPYGPNPFVWPFYLSKQLLSAFETGDSRFTNWVGLFTSGTDSFYFPYKYKIKGGPLSTPLNEYLMVLRLSEQYLIRAEAEANGAPGGSGAAITDLNIIRNRAGLPSYAGATDPISVLNAIYHERQVELFAEWGHRWLDLKRTGTVNSVMGSPGNVCQFKGGTWSDDWQVYPVPRADIVADPNLTQNPGYN